MIKLHLSSNSTSLLAADPQFPTWFLAGRSVTTTCLAHIHKHWRVIRQIHQPISPAVQIYEGKNGCGSSWHLSNKHERVDGDWSGGGADRHWVHAQLHLSMSASAIFIINMFNADVLLCFKTSRPFWNVNDVFMFKLTIWKKSTPCFPPVFCGFCSSLA